ncbi:Acetyl-CoA:oxalate CoA-transferase [anaerobic digester metagenome]
MSAIFEGIKVLDFTNNAAGPSCTALLADFGAEIIKIERPVVGDDSRSFPPRIKGQTIFNPWLNRGKKSIEIALDDSVGIEIVKRMIPDMDIIVESFRPGVMAKFGLDYESVKSIKENIIYCSISAFGQSGSMAKKPGYDLIAQGLSGLMDLTGEKDGPPEKHGSILGDYIGGINAFGAVSSALYHHLRTGEGQYIDIALLDGLIYLNTSIEYTNAEVYPTRQGNHNTALCPYGVFNGKNGQSMILCAPNNKLWAVLCKTINREDAITDETFASASARIKNLPKVIDLIEEYASQFDDLEEAIEVLDAAGIPCCKVLTTRDVINYQQVLERQMVVDVLAPKSLQNEGVPMFKMRGNPLKFSKTPAFQRQAPDLGQHNNEILERYGLSAESVNNLERDWADKVKN